MSDALSWDRDGTTITVTRHGYFSFEEGGETYASLEEARVAVDKRHATAKAAQKVKLALPALYPDGEPCVITGIHAGTGQYMATPARTSPAYNNQSRPAYVDTPQVRRVLALLLEAEKRVDALGATLAHAALPAIGLYVKQSMAKDYPMVIHNLTENYAVAIKNAEALQEAK